MSHQPRNSLYVVSTPIGNLQDVTFRALEVLDRVSMIVSENVRKTRNLLRHHDIRTRVRSYREENSGRMIPVVMKQLREGGSVALVAEAGTPGVSDPGRRLVEAARSGGFPVVPVPGPSAVAAAVSVAGMREARFVFEGFLPRRSSKRRQRLADLAPDGRLLVFFEAPHRLVKCLKDMLDILGDRRCVVAREMTKAHEDITVGCVSGFIARYAAKAPRGEIVIVCDGAAGEDRVGRSEEDVGENAGLRKAFRDEARRLLRTGKKRREVARIIGKKYGVKSNLVYSMITAEQRSPRKED